MYSTKLNLKTKRFIAKCIVNQSGPKLIDFVVDTGAKYTCCNYLSIDTKLNEAEFENCPYKCLGGIIGGEVLKVYKYHVTQFTIGTVNVGEQDIWVTFDKRATDDVLGMDILESVYFLYDPKDKELRVSKEKKELD